MTPPGSRWVVTLRGWTLERDGAHLARIDRYAEGWRAQVGQRFSPGAMIALDAVQRWAERAVEERALPIDDDVIRDLVVVRTSRGECCACAKPTTARRSFVQLEGRFVAVTGLCEITGQQQNYSFCSTGCSDWLDAQELLGRLPHQSREVPRARWALLAPWTDRWAFYVGGEYVAHARPHGSAWFAHVLQGDRSVEQSSLEDAQGWAEIEVVRAMRLDAHFARVVGRR